MHAIEAHGLTKSFRNVRAVDGVDLVVEEGGIVGLLGPNGAGKTTTIMMLLGIIEPDDGHVSVLGHRFPEGRGRALAEANFAASYIGMPDRMRVGEIMEVYADLYASPHERVAEVAHLFGVSHLLGCFPSEMSSGQKTLVTLARSMLNHPRLLILDEPTASLDPEVAARVRAVLTEAHRERGFTLLITSHNMADIERMCGRVVFIARGRVVADDTPAAISARYGAFDLEAAFLTIAAEARI